MYNYMYCFGLTRTKTKSIIVHQCVQLHRFSVCIYTKLLLKINLRFSEHLYMYMYVHGLIRHKCTHYKGTTCIHVCAHQSFFAGHNLKIAQLSTVAIRPFCKGS